MLDFFEAVTGEGDAIDLFSPTSVWLDLQEAIGILKFLTLLNFSLRGQTKKFNKKRIIQERTFFHYLYQNIKSYVDYAYFEYIIKYHTITVP